MRRILPGLIVGLIFGAGLALSDMINPARVLAFLDPLGAWDPTLAFVMAGALLPSALGYAVVRRMKAPLMAEHFCIPANRAVERQLLAGAVLFGVGWGLVGFCPGPAIAALAFSWQAVIFAIGMVAGMSLHWIATLPHTASRLRKVRAMSEIRQIAPEFAVTGQIRTEDLSGIAAQGFRAIVNNRPDREETGQPSSDELAAEAGRLGLAYRSLPVIPGSISDQQARLMGRLLDDLPGPVLAFCRSGRRSVTLWALAQARRGGVDSTLAAARAAGHDLEALRPRLETLASAGAR